MSFSWGCVFHLEEKGVESVFLRCRFGASFSSDGSHRLQRIQIDRRIDVAVEERISHLRLG